MGKRSRSTVGFFKLFQALEPFLHLAASTTHIQRRIQHRFNFENFDCRTCIDFVINMQCLKMYIFFSTLSTKAKGHQNNLQTSKMIQRPPPDLKVFDPPLIFKMHQLSTLTLSCCSHVRATRTARLSTFAEHNVDTISIPAQTDLFLR